MKETTAKIYIQCKCGNRKEAEKNIEYPKGTDKIRCTHCTECSNGDDVEFYEEWAVNMFGDHINEDY